MNELREKVIRALVQLGQQIRPEFNEFAFRREIREAAKRRTASRLAVLQVDDDATHQQPNADELRQPFVAQVE